MCHELALRAALGLPLGIEADIAVVLRCRGILLIAVWTAWGLEEGRGALAFADSAARAAKTASICIGAQIVDFARV